MKKSILAICLLLTCIALAQAQKAAPSASSKASSQNSASIDPGTKSIDIGSNTSITAQLQNTVDARQAKVGDQVVLRTTKDIKSNGRTVVKKGARLIGQISEVAKKGKDQTESRVGIIFDRLEHGSLAIPITASISSITDGRAAVGANNDEMFGSSASGSGRATASTTSSNGALLGAVGAVANPTTGTVGSVVGSTTSAVGSAVSSSTNTVGSTTSGLGRSLGRIRISESSSTSAQGGAVLSLQGDNLRLEKGTNFSLVLSQSGSAATRPDQ